MNRRQFLIHSGVVSAGLAGASALPAWARAEEDAYFSGFRAGLKQHRWLAAFAGVAADLDAGPITFEGKLPKELRGVLHRNGPALFERAGQRYHHWFDGDGMVQAYAFTDQGLKHRGRFVRTRKFKSEEAAGRFLHPGFGTTAKVKVPITGPDAVNPANTNVLVHAGRLLALCEAGSAHEMNLETMETVGTVTWRDDLKGMPFSAHPKLEPDGTLWNFGAFNNHIALYQIGADGKLVKAEVIKAPDVAMCHDFVVSQRHLIFVLPPMRMNIEKLRAGSSFVDAIDILKDAPMRVLTVEKGDFSRRQMYELPPGFVFHFGNAWEDKDGLIRFDYVRSDPGADVMTATMRALMRGDVAGMGDSGNSLSTQVVIDPARGTIRQESFKEDVEFPRVDPRFVARRNRQLFHTAGISNGGNDSDSKFGLNAVLRYDLDSGKSDRYVFPREYSLEEHIPIPRPGSTREGDGWLVGCAFNARTGKTEVNVFDAQRLAEGPLATAKLPYAIPLGFHGHFTAA